MTATKQPAITKHPKGTASFCLRVKTADGDTWEACTEIPLPIARIIAALETDYLGYMRALDKPAVTGNDVSSPGEEQEHDT